MNILIPVKKASPEPLDPESVQCLNILLKHGFVIHQITYNILPSEVLGQKYISIILKRETEVPNPIETLNQTIQSLLIEQRKN